MLLLAHTSLTLRTSTVVDVGTARTPQTHHAPTYLPDEKPQGLVFARRPPAAAHGCRRAALASEFHRPVHAVMTWVVGIKVKYITSHLLLLLLLVLLLLLLLLVLPLLLLLVLASGTWDAEGMRCDAGADADADAGTDTDAMQMQVQVQIQMRCYLNCYLNWNV